MMVLAHAAVGAAVGVASENSILGFAAGFASHFVLDAIPHFDAGSLMPKGNETYHTREYIWAIADVIISVLLLYVLVSNTTYSINLIAGGIGGMAPDIILNTPFWRYWTRNLPGLKWLQIAVHKGWHQTVTPKNWLVGSLTQIIAIIGALWYLKLLSL